MCGRKQNCQATHRGSLFHNVVTVLGAEWYSDGRGGRVAASCRGCHVDQMWHHVQESAEKEKGADQADSTSNMVGVAVCEHKLHLDATGPTTLAFSMHLVVLRTKQRQREGNKNNDKGRNYCERHNARRDAPDQTPLPHHTTTSPETGPQTPCHHSTCMSPSQTSYCPSTFPHTCPRSCSGQHPNQSSDRCASRPESTPAHCHLLRQGRAPPCLRPCTDARNPCQAADNKGGGGLSTLVCQSAALATQHAYHHTTALVRRFAVRAKVQGSVSHVAKLEFAWALHATHRRAIQHGERAVQWLWHSTTSGGTITGSTIPATAYHQTARSCLFAISARRNRVDAVARLRQRTIPDTVDRPAGT